jgi:hypothetical protein
MNAEGWIARLRERAATVDVLAVADDAEADARRAAADRRRARLTGAGVPVDPEAAEAAVVSPGACPMVAGHEGSEAAARAVEALLADDHARTLLLVGPTGRGKSFAATWAIAEGGGAWLAAADCRVAEWNDLRPRAAGARLLVLDDLGRESTDWSARELADLLELRHNRGLRTIVTSNLPTRKLAERYGERLASRWGDGRFTATVEVMGGDLRRRGTR